MSKLRVELVRYENCIIGKVLEMPAELTPSVDGQARDLWTSGEYSISNHWPTGLSCVKGGMRLSLRPDERIPPCSLASTASAQRIVAAFAEGVCEINKRQPKAEAPSVSNRLKVTILE